MFIVEGMELPTSEWSWIGSVPQILYHEARFSLSAVLLLRS